MKDNKILKKLSKILNHAKSCEEIGSLEEAQAFMSRANELALRHGLDIAEANAYDEGNSDDTIEKEMVDPREAGFAFSRKRIPWQQRLAERIANYNGCRILITTGSNLIWFAGRKRDRQICSYLFGYAVRNVTKYAQKEYDRLYEQHWQQGTTEEMYGWKKSFLSGFVVGVGQKFQEMHDAMRQEVGSEKYALVVTDKKIAVNKWMTQFTGRVGGFGGMSGGNSDGFMAGKKYGKGMTVHKGVGTKGGGVKQLGGGRCVSGKNQSNKKQTRG